MDPGGHGQVCTVSSGGNASGPSTSSAGGSGLGGSSLPAPDQAQAQARQQALDKALLPLGLQHRAQALALDALALAGPATRSLLACNVGLSARLAAQLLGRVGPALTQLSLAHNQSSGCRPSFGS